MADNKAFPEPAPPYEEKGYIPLASRASYDYDAAYTSLSEAGKYREYYFYKGNGLSPKARIRSSDGTDYRLLADIHKSKPSTIRVQEGKGSSTASLGALTFPPTHNDFQIHIPQICDQMIRVKAKVGHPHPNSYGFTLPSTIAPSSRKVVWKRSGNSSVTNGYHLHDDFTDELLASCSLVSGVKQQIALRWRIDPSSYWEEMIVMLSFLGVVSRLKLRGKDHEGLPDGMLRYNAFWFMAILGTAAIT